ncbi:MAG TPA: hypothetical protein VH761_04675, partial [Ilumatobacteraceae bacterium]
LHAGEPTTPSDLRLTGSFTIPVSAGKTYLRFDHSFQMEYDESPVTYYDGGVVEFSTTGGANWTDAGSMLPTINGYVGTLQSAFGNPLANRPAFSGPSPGYETTRIDISGLAGTNVKLRFRLGTDSGNTFLADGWFIDDVSIYTCATPSPLVSLVPGRLLDSRPGQTTVDGQFNGIGLRSANTITPVTVLNRGGVSADASAVVLNVTVTEAQAGGYLTVYPCGGAPPGASNLNYTPGTTVANAVIAKVGTSGQVCIFNQSPTHLLIDVNGYFPAGSAMTSLVPGRLLDSRPGQTTVDGQFNGIGLRPANTITAVTVLNRGGVSADASAVVLNITATGAQAAGFLTVYPCGDPQPNASNLNYTTGTTTANAVIAKVGTNGQVCIFNQTPTHLIIDVNGYFP